MDIPHSCCLERMDNLPYNIPLHSYVDVVYFALSTAILVVVYIRLLHFRFRFRFPSRRFFERVVH